MSGAVVHTLFPAAQAEPSRFEEVWKHWPRKDGKAVARSKFDAIVAGGFQSRTLDKSSGQYLELELSATAEQIIDGVKAYVDSQIDKRTYRFKDDGRFIPHLATWLGAGRWMDFE